MRKFFLYILVGVLGLSIRGDADAKPRRKHRENTGEIVPPPAPPPRMEEPASAEEREQSLALFNMVVEMEGAIQETLANSKKLIDIAERQPIYDTLHMRHQKHVFYAEHYIMKTIAAVKGFLVNDKDPLLPFAHKNFVQASGSLIEAFFYFCPPEIFLTREGYFDYILWSWQQRYPEEGVGKPYFSPQKRAFLESTVQKGIDLAKTYLAENKPAPSDFIPIRLPGSSCNRCRNSIIEPCDLCLEMTDVRALVAGLMLPQEIYRVASSYVDRLPDIPNSEPFAAAFIALTKQMKAVMIGQAKNQRHKLRQAKVAGGLTTKLAAKQEEAMKQLQDNLPAALESIYWDQIYKNPARAAPSDQENLSSLVKTSPPDSLQSPVNQSSSESEEEVGNYFPDPTIDRVRAELDRASIEAGKQTSSRLAKRKRIKRWSQMLKLFIEQGYGLENGDGSHQKLVPLPAIEGEPPKPVIPVHQPHGARKDAHRVGQKQQNALLSKIRS